VPTRWARHLLPQLRISAASDIRPATEGATAAAFGPAGAVERNGTGDAEECHAEQRGDGLPVARGGSSADQAPAVTDGRWRRSWRS
jgi:hypothetical protein